MRLSTLFAIMGTTQSGCTCPPAATQKNCQVYTLEYKNGYDSCVKTNTGLHATVNAARQGETATMDQYRQLAAEHTDLQRKCAQPIVGGHQCATEAETNRLNYFTCLKQKVQCLDRLADDSRQADKCDRPIEKAKYIDEAWEMARRLWAAKTGDLVPVSSQGWCS